MARVNAVGSAVQRERASAGAPRSALTAGGATGAPERQRRKPRLLLTGATPLDALLPSWLRMLRGANAPATTQSAYRIGVERFMTYLRNEGRSLSAGEIAREDVQAFVEKLLELDYAPATARLWLAAVTLFFDWLVEEGEIATSPAAHVRSPRLPERLTRTLTEEEARRLLRATHGDDFAARRDEALLRLALDSGLRESELASIRLADFDLDAGALRVVGKGDRERVIAFGAKTASAIDRYLRLRRAHRCADLPWLWIGHHGKFGAKGIYLMVVARGEQAGLGHIRPHVLRHTWANLCLSNGMQQNDLRELGGWRSDTVMRRYGASLRGERALAAHKAYGPGDQL